MQTASLLGHVQEILLEILPFTKPADTIFQTFFRTRKYLGSRDRKFIAETTYGVLRHLRECDTRLQHVVNDELFPEDRALLLACVFLAMNPAVDTPIHAEDVLPKLKGSRIQERGEEIFSRLKELLPSSSTNGTAAKYSFQDWMVQRWVGQFGEQEAEKLCASLNQQAPLTIRTNALKATVEDCRGRLKVEGVETDLVDGLPNALQLRKRVNVFGLQTFKDGLFEMQDAGSQMLPLMVDPKPTDKLLDACAGAGGKTLQFAALMKNRGEIFAADIHSYRLEELRTRSKRAGAQNVRIKLVTELTDLQKDHVGFFDVVFVDAPCSGVGTIRRNPGMKWSVTESMVHELSEKQSAILEQCGPLVKPGGRLVYATCSLFKEENEDVVSKFLAGHDEFKPSALTGPSYLLPHQRNTDGFFCAAMQRAR